jgi:hypothetical protein
MIPPELPTSSFISPSFSECLSIINNFSSFRPTNLTIRRQTHRHGRRCPQQYTKLRCRTEKLFPENINYFSSQS